MEEINRFSRSTYGERFQVHATPACSVTCFIAVENRVFRSIPDVIHTFHSLCFSLIDTVTLPSDDDRKNAIFDLICVVISSLLTKFRSIFGKFMPIKSLGGSTFGLTVWLIAGAKRLLQRRAGFVNTPNLARVSSADTFPTVLALVPLF